MLEERRIRGRERKSILTEDEINRDREHHRFAYHKWRKQAVGAEINSMNQQTIEGNLPTSFIHLHRSSRIVNQDRMDEPGPSTAGASTSKGKAVDLVPSPEIVVHQHGDVHATEASRKRKGKSVAVYQERPRANRYVLAETHLKA